MGGSTSVQFCIMYEAHFSFLIASPVRGRTRGRGNEGTRSINLPIAPGTRTRIRTRGTRTAVPDEDIKVYCTYCTTFEWSRR